MNTSKNWNYNKLISFFLIALVLLSILVVSANGWQSDNPGENEESQNDKQNQVPDEEGGNTNEPETPTVEVKKFYHHITGLEVLEEDFGQEQIAYVIDSASPLCGVANCNILVEIPLENGKTRFIMIADRSDNFSKIGSITYTRNYISNIATALGAAVVSLGTDESIEYEHINSGTSFIDLPKHSGAYYTEYTYFTYTNTNLLSSISGNNKAKLDVLPYTFVQSGDKTSGSIASATISLPYSNDTSLVYSKEQGKYILCKSGSDKIDVSTANKAEFDNVFVLFADTVTYESADSTEMLMNTLGEGEGYYAFGGMAQKITWKLGEDGKLEFYDEAGEPLKCARGKSYIAYVKSSKSNEVLFS